MDKRLAIYKIAREEGFPPFLSMLMGAQAAHETDNFTSNVFRKCNNAFGYKSLSTSTDCTGSPEGNSYKFYRNLEDSAKEVVNWIKRRQREGKFPADLSSVKTANQYATLLKNAGYYGDPIGVYEGGLTRYSFIPTDSVKTAGVGIGTVLVGIATIYMLRTMWKK